VRENEGGKGRGDRQQSTDCGKACQSKREGQGFTWEGGGVKATLEEKGGGVLENEEEEREEKIETLGGEGIYVSTVEKII